ncbi:MAG: helix-hairpin-helix domain-containing protein [Oscillospiraceae bacterium]|nr:helix-hairpin-helix domain-containing protein [Oscillospiraceae bacterium]
MKTDLTKIPYIGPKTAQCLIDAGYPDIASLKGQDPEDIYMNDCLVKGYTEHRAVLCFYRLAVAYADGDGALPPDKHHWWNWKT